MRRTNDKTRTSLKLAGRFILASIGLLNVKPVAFAQDPDLQLRYSAPPVYPLTAKLKKQQGWVQLKYSIDEEGNVIDIIVVDHCVHATLLLGQGACDRSDVFDESALNAVSQWKYVLKIEDGVAVPRDDVQTMVRYDLED